jgi:pimeloyl-ACP methyl ester carboxylesterase
MQLPMRRLANVVVGAGREALAVGAAVANYRRRFEPPVPPPTLRPSWATRPVLLVHGFGHNAGAWSKLATRLAAAGFSDLSTITYGIDDDVPGIAARIAEEVEAVTTSRAIDRVHLVGHSLGGVAIRYWYDVLGGDQQADAVVTLGAPLRGVIWTRLPFLRAPARDLAADSPVSRTLGRWRGRHELVARRLVERDGRERQRGADQHAQHRDEPETGVDLARHAPRMHRDAVPPAG